MDIYIPFFATSFTCCLITVLSATITMFWSLDHVDMKIPKRYSSSCIIQSKSFKMTPSSTKSMDFVRSVKVKSSNYIIILIYVYTEWFSDSLAYGSVHDKLMHWSPGLRMFQWLLVAVCLQAGFIQGSKNCSRLKILFQYYTIYIKITSKDKQQTKILRRWRKVKRGLKGPFPRNLSYTHTHTQKNHTKNT